MGNIGEPVRKIDLEPFPEEAPAEPVVTPAPAEPVKEPEPAGKAVTCDDHMWNTETGRCTGRVGHDGGNAFCHDCPQRLENPGVTLSWQM